ncbi:MAG: hypothetical protein NTV88_03730 [Candidatus Micrarchaeota archaeon]|nr:hypothetical protein [Candidatus Micrarchaeota archaeon]
MLVAAAFAIAGIALLLLMSETAQGATVAQAIVSEPNTLLVVSGTAANVTADKFSLCDRVCISVRSNGLPTALLLVNGKATVVTGRMKEYRTAKYMVAEKIEVK